GDDGRHWPCDRGASSCRIHGRIRRRTMMRAKSLGMLALLVAGLVSLHAQAPAPIRLYVFDGGTLESDPARYRLTKEDVGTTQLSVAAYLIVHPKGVLLWDTGAVPDENW